MSGLVAVLPDVVQLLHNSGVFSYRLLPLIGFLTLACFYLIFLIFLWVYLIFAYRRPRWRSGKVVVSFTGVCLLGLAVFWAGYGLTASRTYFALGYGDYLSGRVDVATNRYLKSLRSDPAFEKPLIELVRVCEEEGCNSAILKEIGHYAVAQGNSSALTRLAKAWEEIGNHEESLELYLKSAPENEPEEKSGGVIRNLLAMGRIDEAKNRLSQVRDRPSIATVDAAELAYYDALISLGEGEYARAEDAVGSALLKGDCDPRVWVLKGKIEDKLGRNENALVSFQTALRLKREVPDAYFEIGKLHHERGEFEEAIEAFTRCLYYDNTNSLAYALLEMIKNGGQFPAEGIRRRLGLISYKKGDRIPLVVNVGDDVCIKLSVDKPERNNVKIRVIEPYGFGLEAMIESASPGAADGKDVRGEVTVRIKGKRSSQINLGNPWLLNVVVVDLATGEFDSQEIKIIVNDTEREGQVFFVITEDLENSGDFPHTDDTIDLIDLDPYEIEMDLIQKPALADEIAEKWGVRWSHIVDIGSTILMLNWFNEMGLGEEWGSLSTKMQEYMKHSVAIGNDIQLHIHGYNIPGNRLFRGYYDRGMDRVLYKGNTRRVEDSHGNNGAWAYNFDRMGDFEDEQSRVGSVFRGIRLLESELSKVNPDYQTSFFRAGEYEFGRGARNERCSIASLRNNKILAASDAYDGKLFERSFRFFRRVGRNVYFTNWDNIRQKAKSLLDVGILQVIPVPTINGHDYLTPVDGWQHVKYNYDLCVRQGKILPGLYVIMEMYHLNTANWSGRWDSLDRGYGDWARMEEQFRSIKEKCPKMQFVTVSEAVKTYYDMYVPDVVAIRARERRLDDGIYLYDVDLLGKDIDISVERPHFVSIKAPSYLVGKIAKADLLYNNTVVKSWKSVNTYEDLEAQYISKEGYQFRVQLRE
jgi:tetratricopeptide (TPR) repeat protein